MVDILVTRNFERASGAVAKNMPVDVTERDEITPIASLVTNNVGFVSLYLPAGQYDWVGDGFRIPFDVLEPNVVQPAPPFVHDQSAPAGTWIVVHNRGWKPPVTIELSGEPESGDIYADLTYTDLNTVTIEMPTPLAGKAYIP